MEPNSKKNPVVSEFWNCQFDEECFDVDLPIQGDFPAWLNGTLIRNGPTKFTVYLSEGNIPEDISEEKCSKDAHEMHKANGNLQLEAGIDGQSVHHWFDGLAMLHGFSFHQTKVQYSNRFLRTEAYHKMFEEGSVDFLGFANDPCHVIFRKLSSLFFPHQELQNGNVNVAKFFNSFVALTEVPLPVEFDLKTLQTLGALSYKDKLPHDNSWECAHPHFDRDQAFNCLIRFSFRCAYVIYRLQDNGRHVLAEIPVEEPAYMHSFAMTDNFVILAEYPLTVSPLKLFLSKKGFINNFAWHPERGTTFIVVNRQSGEVVGRFKTEPFFAFHHVNAFETESGIDLDIAVYPNPSIVEELADYFHYARKFEPSAVKRYHLSFSDHTVRCETLADVPLELPRINYERCNGKPYQYIYGVDLRQLLAEGEERNLFKVDTATKNILRWSEAGCYPGEPVFVPDPSSTAKEDGGVVLSVVLDPKNARSFLVVLDAITFKERARVYAPHLIAPGLHGQFFSKVDI